MLRPRVPINEQPSGEIIPVVTTLGTIAPQPSTQAPCGCQHHTPAPIAPAPAAARPTVQLTPGSIALLVGGGTAVVLVIGAVLVSMLLAVAITAGSLAVVAVVVRSILTTDNRR
ncbi:SpdD-like protein [Streptomyces sp. KL116D]|uniref:SpdD-like protein n=1 Tax=Streptomyces sp. KL116D TaxID=3045152 RepID=UPI003555E830